MDMRTMHSEESTESRYDNVAKSDADMSEIDATEIADKLCTACSKFDFYSLFTGYRYFKGNPDGSNRDLQLLEVATLAEVVANAACPFCRLLKHALYSAGPHI